MPPLKRYLRIFQAIVDAFRGAPGTAQYPYAPLTLPDSFRGAIVSDPEKCSGCGLCVRDCPADALLLLKESRDEFKLIHYPSRCAYCGQCQESCHKGAIYHSAKLVEALQDLENSEVTLVNRVPRP